jgi:type I restriction enzyme S subunit
MSAQCYPTIRLGEAVERVTKGTTPTTHGYPYTDGGVFFLRVENLQNGVVDTSKVKTFISPEADRFLKRSSLEAGDVLISIAGTIGRTAIVREHDVPANTNQAVAIIRGAAKRFEPVFLRFALDSPLLHRHITGEARGGAMQNISLENVRDVIVPVPPLPEQRRIVAEIEKQFTRLEAGVAALRLVQANLKRYRAAVLKAACEGRLVPTEAAWEKTTLDKVSTVLAGYGFPERLQGRATGEIGFFKVGDISAAWKRSERILTQANHYISKADAAELRAKLLPTGTVVFAKIGAAIALNRRAIIGEPSLVDNNVMGLYAGERIHPRFLFHFLCTQKLDGLARATTVPSIRKGDVEGIELMLPPLTEQTRIVAEVDRRLSVVEELESVVTANLQRATRLRQSILQKAFTGELATQGNQS